MSNVYCDVPYHVFSPPGECKGAHVFTIVNLPYYGIVVPFNYAMALFQGEELFAAGTLTALLVVYQIKIDPMQPIFFLVFWKSGNMYSGNTVMGLITSNRVFAWVESMKLMWQDDDPIIWEPQCAFPLNMVRATWYRVRWCCMVAVPVDTPSTLSKGAEESGAETESMPDKGNYALGITLERMSVEMSVQLYSLYSCQINTALSSLPPHSCHHHSSHPHSLASSLQCPSASDCHHQ
eukprot:1399726-Rhodomonas_salina.1